MRSPAMTPPKPSRRTCGVITADNPRAPSMAHAPAGGNKRPPAGFVISGVCGARDCPVRLRVRLAVFQAAQAGSTPARGTDTVRLGEWFPRPAVNREPVGSNPTLTAAYRSVGQSGVAASLSRRRSGVQIPSDLLRKCGRRRRGTGLLNRTTWVRLPPLPLTGMCPVRLRVRSAASQAAQAGSTPAQGTGGASVV